MSMENKWKKESEEVRSTTPADNGNGNGEKEWTFLGMLTLIMFITALVVPYIYLSHKSDNKIRRMDKLNRELKELRSEYITLKSEIISTNKQSDVAKRLADKDIKPLKEAPYQITKD